MLQCCAIQKLHRNERLAVLFTNVMDYANVGVIQGGSGLRFSPEPGQGIYIFGYPLRQELECYETMETCIFGFVNDSHPATAEFFDDAVVRDDLANHCVETALANAC